MGTKMKRFLSMLLAVLMVVSTPVTVFAENGTATGSTSAEDMVSIDAVAKNTATDKTYEDLMTALGEAADGESIVLSKDVETTIVTVPENVTLDLNGHTLTASYVASFGDVVDGSADNAGLLKAAPSRIIVQEDNEQISVRTAEGYKFFEVIKYNTRYVEEESKYAFQPFIEAGAHEILKQGAENAGATVNVRISWVSADGRRSQDFVYNDEMTFDFFESYDAEKDQYGRMFTLVLNGAELYKNLTFCAVVVSDTGVSNYSKSVVLNEDVTTEGNGELSENVTLNNEQASAFVAEGTKVDGEALTLTTEEMSETTADIQLADGEEMLSLNVHVNGVAKDNTVPVLVTIDEIAPEYLNQGNITLYHVENGETVEMTRVYSLEEVDAHNEFYYDILTGTITMALASFSEIAIVNDAGNAWNGEYDYSWYTNAVAPVDGEGATEYTIANADQLAAFGAIVGGMNGQTQDSFAGKTVKLLADVNLGDYENANVNLIFHPIGYYYTDDKNNDKTTGDYYSTVYSFEGTFDGNGHTISSFYQNTWEIKGDYEGNYYSDAMGLFGYVVNGTVKNLTVDHFSSDGEFTPTGVIAAYAVNSTFENIAITNCNPRVYNTGNGGIVGIGGNTDDPETYKLTFNNITIDNSNIITALWGSWDVACGGLVGMFRGKGHAYMTNCHVAAQIDVYNDVCGNYQYYWYRYSGMMIGTNKNMITDANGYTVPETDKFHAENCTVHFGEWNNYYYCELVANSLASYTHDHQFSRLTEVDSIDVENMTFTVDDKTTAIPTSGRQNYVVINGKPATENAACYHFVDGKVWNHEDAGTETVNGVEGVLKENNQHIYLPFNQLFTGYGWGVKHIPVYNGEDYAFKGITILDREVADSVEKFEKADTAKDEYTTGTTVTIGELFKTKTISDTKLAIKGDKVQVTVSPVGESSTASGKYVANTTDWTQGTLTFSGSGAAIITITDYYFCTPTTIFVNIETTEKFETKFTGDFLYRVGNKGTVKLDSLFKKIEGAQIGTVSVTVETVYGASGTYTPNATWTNGEIQFSGTGLVKVTITDDDYCTPTELILEVVDAVNATTAISATENNVVLLNDSNVSSITVSGRYTLYGNGFTLNYTGNGQYLNNGLKQGVVTVSENGTLDNLKVKASIYPAAYLYYTSNSFGEAVQDGPLSAEGDKKRYHYQLSAVAASGNATISNCYIYGGRNNIFVNTGDVTIKDSVLECGIVANVQIQSNSSHTITFEDVTTIQKRKNATLGDTSKVMMGAGILVGPDTTENPKIVLDGEFKQYNWVNEDDASAVSNSMAQAIIKGALEATAYNHTVNGKTASNLGIIYMNRLEASITNNTGLPYVLDDISMKVMGNNTVNGKVYSLKEATEEQIYFDVENADRNTVNGYYEPQFKYSADLGGQYIAKTDEGDEYCYKEGDTIKVMFPGGETRVLDLAKLIDLAKYTGQNLNLNIICKDSNGNFVELDKNKMNLSEANNYTVTYTVNDELFYDKNGQQVIGKIKCYSWDIGVEVSLKDVSIPNARFAFDTEKQSMGYKYKIDMSSFSGGNVQFLPFLAGLRIYDYNGQEEYLRFNGDEDFNKIAAVTITGYTSNNHVLIEVKLTDGGIIDIDTTTRAVSGGSTHTGKIKTANNTVYYVNDGFTSAEKTTWVISSYKFTGNSGVEINSGEVTFNGCTEASIPGKDFSTTIKYTVTYDANEGNCGQTIGYATSASTAVTLPTPTRSGYIFAGWYKATSGGTRVGGAGDSYTPGANITLYAQWGKPCTVTYNANGGSCGTPSEKYTGTALTLPTPTRDGYWFMGWYDAAEGGNKVGNAGVTYNPAGDETLYAQWSPVYTVSYNANGGSCDTASAKYTGTALILPTPTRENYKFAGWYDAENGGKEVSSPYTPTKDIILYAHWEEPIVVTYNANGGSCGIASEKYTGTALTLPTPTRDGYWFMGWYDAAEGGNKVGNAGVTYNPAGDETLYAQWSPVYTVSYNANGGSCDTKSQTYLGTSLSLATPTRSGYTFNGWYTAASGGNKVGAAGESYTPSANITLYAQWTINSYTIKVTTSNAEVKVNGTTVKNKGTVSIQYGDQVTVEVTYSKSDGRTTTITGKDGTTYTSPFSMPAQDVTISASSKDSCVTSSTLVTLADGTQKRIDEITYADNLLVWNFFEGKYDNVPASIIFNHGYDLYTVLALHFSDGTIVNTINGHGFFDVEKNEFSFIDEENVEEYIGHHFVKSDGDSYKEVELVSYDITEEYTGCYSIQSALHNNFITEGMFSLTVPPHEGWFDYFEIGENMKYDEEKMQEDIQKYGLYSYEDFSDYVTYEQFIAFNGPYLKVLVGRDVLTYDQIIELIKTYVQ